MFGWEPTKPEAITEQARQVHGEAHDQQAGSAGGQGPCAHRKSQMAQPPLGDLIVANLLFTFSFSSTSRFSKAPSPPRASLVST